MRSHFDVIVIGAGASGLFCAARVASRGKKVLVIDHANKVGKKILMSGGGRCNFTNLNTSPDDFSSKNKHFCKSALSQYTAYDFLDFVESHGLEYVEKEPGQLFCKHSSKDMLKILLDECASHSVKIFKKCEIRSIKKENKAYTLETSINTFNCNALVVATGGLSIPTLGASGFGYELAKQFGHEIIPTSAALVPVILDNRQLEMTRPLAGVSVEVEISQGKRKTHSIKDMMLFTHRGISGPAVLKMSMYFSSGVEINVNMLPGIDLENIIKEERINHPKQQLENMLGKLLPRKIVLQFLDENLSQTKLDNLTNNDIRRIKESLQQWEIIAKDTEGYKTAEVTLGGVSTDKISSKTMESQLSSGLYFIGEVLDVTGQLGGFNFQWAWSSAWCAACSI